MSDDESEQGPEQERATDGSAEVPVEIPYTDLAPETLRNLLEDLVTRDGTDYGAVEKTLEQKTAALLRQLESGEAKLMFDLTTETIGLMTSAELKRSSRSD
jgi:uncharacterized protein YheU (UPF0270 family)